MLTSKTDGIPPRDSPTATAIEPDLQAARRRIVYRTLAILLAILPFAAAEVALRLGGVGDPDLTPDPFVGFTDVRPLWVLDEDAQEYKIAPSRQPFFAPDAFPRRKSSNDFRIFVVGGSTVQGRPYAIETSFGTWLELALRAADPRRNWDVVNCGGVSYASYRLVPIVEEISRLEPDLLIVYTGHNEFLEARSYDQLLRIPAWLRDVQARLMRLHLVNGFRSAWNALVDEPRGGAASADVNLPTEVDALLDYRGGLDEYHRDDAWQDAAARHFAFNLGRMRAIADRAGVPLILVNPAENLRDCPPFKSEHRQDLSEEDRRRFESLWARARSLPPVAPEKLAEKIDLLRRALELDGRFADARFLLARCLAAAGGNEEAKREFARARDEDVCPLRMLGVLHETLLRFAQKSKTPCVDAAALLAARAEGGVPGEDLFLDHVHPTITSHQWIAVGLFESMRRLGMIQNSAEDSREQRVALFQEHLDALDQAYFARGAQRLEGLRRWTQGRADKLRRPAGVK